MKNTAVFVNFSVTNIERFMWLPATNIIDFQKDLHAFCLIGWLAGSFVVWARQSLLA